VNEKALKMEELELPGNLIMKKVGALFGKKDSTVAVTFEVR
jgi:hypothetical protein